MIAQRVRCIADTSGCHPRWMSEREHDHGPDARRRAGRLTIRRDMEHVATRGVEWTEDETLLEPSPRPDFLDTDPWRALRILSEFVEGFDALAEVGPAVTRLRLGADAAETDPTTSSPGRSARALAEAGYAVITGGGPGIMEAANRGCHEARRPVGRLQHRAAARAGRSTRTSTSASSSATSSPARRCS